MKTHVDRCELRYEPAYHERIKLTVDRVCRLKEPQFSPKRKYPCHRVQECQGCLRRYNRDIAAAINIGYVSFHRLLHAGVHPFRGETEGSLVKRLRSRLELL